MLIIQKHRPATRLTVFAPFLNLRFILLLSLLAYAPTAAAATYSVSNEAEVPVRSGKGTEFKILSLLKDGETVLSLEEDAYWIRVRTQTGREGWVLKRYLSTTPSADDAFSLPSSNVTNEQSEKVSPPSEPTPSTLQPAAEVVAETPPPNQPESTDFPLLNEQPREQDQELEKLRNKLAEVTMENRMLREDERIKWFLAGGGVLIIGWIIGLITCKSGRRKPSLL